MDIEKLTKSELITAALLISFVTAILTGAVIMFLSEDAPKDVIRVSEKVISSDTNSSSDAGVGSEPNMASDAEEVKTRDEILAAATAAVTRVTAASVPPRAGVLIRQDGQLFVITTREEIGTTAEGLFQDGVVVNLEQVYIVDNLAVFAVREASGPVVPLVVTDHNSIDGTTLYVVSQSERPEIITTDVESTSDDLIYTTGNSLPAVSLLLDSNGSLVGVYDRKVGAFRSTGTFTAQ